MNLWFAPQVFFFARITSSGRAVLISRVDDDLVDQLTAGSQLPAHERCRDSSP